MVSAKLRSDVVGLVREAGRATMTYYDAPESAGVREKADQSPVTLADEVAHGILVEGLRRLDPSTPVVSEEAAAAGHIPAVGGTFFLVDPLDGTKPFIRREPQFTINIALIEDGNPVFGLVYAPALEDFYVTVGPGQAAAARLPPSAEACSLAACGLAPVRTRVPDPNALGALVSQIHLDKATQRFLDRYPVVERRAVSSSLKFGLMARGEADIYPRAGPTSEWDTAAGHAVLAAAGGTVTAFDGGPLLYGKPGFRNTGFVAWGRTPLPAPRI